MWIALLASVGVGAAAYYTISKSNNPINKAVESVAPMLTGMTNMNNNNHHQSPQDQSQQQLGPFGMS